MITDARLASKAGSLIYYFLVAFVLHHAENDRVMCVPQVGKISVWQKRQCLRTCLTRVVLGFALAISGNVGISTIAAADEDGVSFWLPGLFGSLAAVP
jgi:hypothetical protein